MQILTSIGSPSSRGSPTSVYSPQHPVAEKSVKKNSARLANNNDNNNNNNTSNQINGVPLQQQTPRKKEVCRDFLNGRCTRNNCKFLHQGQESKESPQPQPYPNPQPRGRVMTRSGGDKRKQAPGKDRRKKNTESFEPLDRPVDMRVMFHHASNDDSYPHRILSRDVICLHGLFDDCAPGDLFERISTELSNGEVDTKLWHGDTHYIVDDKKDWQHKVPTYNMVIERLAGYFDMDVQASRLNVYSDTSQWKPFHHDAAAIYPAKSKIQNFTLAVSFGACRDAAFEHAKTHVVVSMPQPDGCVYAFGRDANAEWKHGILKDATTRNEGRISIILWGKVNQPEE